MPVLDNLNGLIFTGAGRSRRGSIDGLMAVETGDNACVPGAVIPC